MAFTQQVWEQPIKDAIVGGIYYDNLNSGQPLAAFSSVSLGNATDVTNAIAAGIQGAALGNLYVPTPVSAGLPTRRIVGIAMGSTYSGKSISVVTKGIFPAICNEAVTADTRLFHVANVSRTNAQTPLTNLPRILLGVMSLPSGTPTLTYNVGLVNDTAVVPQSTGTNVLYFPLGYALTTTSAQYDLVPVELQTAPFYA